MKLASSQRRPAMILILVLVVIAMLSLAAYTFTELMLTEHQAVAAHGRGIQCRVMADSGLEVVKRFVIQDAETLVEAGGVFQNPGRFQGILVVGDENSIPAERGRFSVVAPQIDDEGSLAPGVRFGLEDESTRLNLNTVIYADEQQENGGRQLLMGLPGMTETIADAILDWMDEDDEPREFGAELDFYSGQDPPYAPKNGPLETVEELLLVREVTPGLLFGPDSNRNGQIDPHETQGGAVGGVDNSDGSLDRGWSAYLTLYSMEKNVRADGTPRINLNEADLTKLYDELQEALGADWATFIVAYRQGGPYTGTTIGIKAGGRQLDLTQPGNIQLTTVLDLIGPQVQVKFKGETKATVLETPFPALPLLMNAYMPVLMDNVAVNASPIIPGRININQAPRTILLGIPGMTEEIAEQIVSKRELEVTADNPGRRHETWLVTEGVVPLERFKTMIPFMTAGGHVFRSQIIGYFEEEGPAARIEAVVDATGETPRIVFWRDLSNLGRGYALETLGIAAE